MVRNILFPTDFSEAANHAFHPALFIASRTGAEITTVHAYIKPLVPAGYMTHTLEEIVNSVHLEEFETFRDEMKELEQLAEKLNYTQVPLRHALNSGTDILKEIIEIANQEEPDMIVLGTTGAKGMKEIFQGSTAAEILENAPCPVLVMPETAVFYGAIRRIGFATDFDANDRQALDWLLSFCHDLKAEVLCFNLPEIQELDFLQKVESWKLGIDPKTPINFAYGDCWTSEPELSEFLAEHNIDVLALVSHRTTFLQELLHPNFGKKLARHLVYPLLGIPERAF